VGAAAVAGLVGLVCAVEARAALCGFLTGEVAETVVFCFSIAVGVVERWQMLVQFYVQLSDILQREPIDIISMAAMLQRLQIQGVQCQRVCGGKDMGMCCCSGAGSLMIDSALKRLKASLRRAQIAGVRAIICDSICTRQGREAVCVAGDIDCTMLGYIVDVGITETKSACWKLRTVSWAQRRR
jgi:hypothetical protein